MGRLCDDEVLKDKEAKMKVAISRHEKEIAKKLADWLKHVRLLHEASPAKDDPIIVAFIKELSEWEELVRVLADD